MTIPTPPSHKTAGQFIHAEEAILEGKFLSHVEPDGWAYRTMKEISEDNKEDAQV